MAKHNNKQQKNGQQGGMEAWVDGSFLAHEGGKSGGAVLRTDASGRRLDVIAFQFNGASPRFPIQESRDAERLTVMAVLETLPAESITRLSSDCSEVVPRLQDIQRNKLNTGKFNGEVFERITAGMQRHPRMAVAQVTRNEGGIPVANAFAQAAARGDIAKMEAEARRFRVPFTFMAADGATHQYSPTL